MNDIFMVHVHIQNVSLSRDQEQKVNCFQQNLEYFVEYINKYKQIIICSICLIVNSKKKITQYCFLIIGNVIVIKFFI